MEEGHDTYHMNVASLVPSVISNRHAFLTYYRQKFSDGGWSVLSSSLGNEPYLKTFADEINDGIVAN